MDASIRRQAKSNVRGDATLVSDVASDVCRDLGIGSVNQSLGQRAVSDAIRFSGRFDKFLEKLRGVGDVAEPVAKRIHDKVAKRVALAVSQLRSEGGSQIGGVAVAGFGTVGKVESLLPTGGALPGGLVGGLHKPKKRSRPEQQQRRGSVLGLDRLAREKRMQDPKRRRAADDASGATDAAGGLLTAQPRQYRRRRMETPSHPGGVNVQAQDAIRARGRDREAQRRRPTTHSGERDGGRERGDERRRNDRSDESSRDRRRGDGERDSRRRSRFSDGGERGRERDAWRRDERDNGGRRSSDARHSRGDGIDHRMRRPPAQGGGGGHASVVSTASTVVERHGIGANFDEWEQPELLRSVEPATPLATPLRDAVGGTPLRRGGDRSSRFGRSGSSGAAAGGGEWEDATPLRVADASGTPMRSVRSDSTRLEGRGTSSSASSAASHDATPAYVYNRWTAGSGSSAGRDGGGRGGSRSGAARDAAASAPSAGGSSSRMSAQLEDQYDEAFYDPDGAGAHEAGDDPFLGE